LKLEGVLIDFGDTLAYIDEEENQKYREAILSTMREHGYEGDFKRLSHVFDDLIRNSMKGEFKNLLEFWQQLLHNLRISERSAMLVEDLENIRSRYSTKLFKLYDKALHVLEVLQSKYKLALVSNCAIGTSDVIEDLKLLEYFDCISLSYEVGVRKPDSQIYLDALDCLGLEPYVCVFVADEISDLEGACDLGLKTLLVRQGSYTAYEARNPDFKPDFECDRISEICSFL
jgi:HAD superfamily hydrolase (TIGR01549 family)